MGYNTSSNLNQTYLAFCGDQCYGSRNSCSLSVFSLNSSEICKGKIHHVFPNGYRFIINCISQCKNKTKQTKQNKTKPYRALKGLPGQASTFLSRLVYFLHPQILLAASPFMLYSLHEPLFPFLFSSSLKCRLKHYINISVESFSSLL